jgi:hypothetical protein
MAKIVGSEEILKKISSQIDSQFPGFIREEGPQFVAFLKAYFEYMEQSGNSIDAIRTLRENKDIDRTLDSFVDYFRKEFMINIPKETFADKRLLVKHIRDFYRTRGSQESYRFLFRALFGQEIEFYYPGDDILRASDGRWKRESRLRVSAPFAKNPRNLEGKTIRGVTSGATAYIQDIIGTTALGIEVYDMTAENIVGSFLDGERVINLDDPTNYATINSQVGSIIDVNITSGGSFHNLGDSVRINGAGSTEDATATVTEVTNIRGGVTIKLAKTGGGYTKENTKVFVTGGNGKDFQVAIDSWKRQTIAGLAINTDVIGSVKNVKLNEGPFFVRYGANSSTVGTKLTGTLTVSTVSNTVTGTGTKFQTQLSVGSLVRVKGVANTLRVHLINSNTSFVAAHTAFQNVSGANGYIGLAASNVYSRLISALSFSASELYSINALALINPGYGYTTLPTIRIVDPFISSLNFNDGYGNIYGNNAVVVANTAPGTIKKLRIVTPGSNFGRYDEATISSITQGNTIIYTTDSSSNTSGSAVTTYVKRQKTFAGGGYPTPSGIIQFPGRYIDTKGFLSWNNRLQDNDYYQEFSYVIRVAELLNKYKNVVKSLLHPAGSKMFSDYMITASVDAGAQVVDEAPIVARRSVRERITAVSTQNSTVNYANSQFSESVTATATQNGSFVANTFGVESVTSITTQDATYVANTFVSETVSTAATHDVTYTANTFATESVTSTATHTATFIANTFASETVTSAATHTATYTANTFRTETVTTTDIASAQKFQVIPNIYIKVLNANSTISSVSGYTVGTYSPVPVNVFDDSPRLVRTAQGISYFANGVFTANTGSISVGGTGSNLYIITVPNSPMPSDFTYQVNAIFSNTVVTLRTNYVPTTANARIWFGI